MCWRFGILTSNYNGPWKSGPGDPDVTDREYDVIHSVFSDQLDIMLGQQDRQWPDLRGYFVGDCYGTRTQQLEFADRDALTPHLVRELQRLLRIGRFERWRIAIVGNLPEDVILIYPSAICTNRRLSNDELDDVVNDIKRRDAEFERRREEEREARIDRVRPFLKDAYADASRGEALAHLVHTEISPGEDGELVRMWVIHPNDDDMFDLDDYETEPDAGHSEDFLLLPDGSLTKRTAEIPIRMTVMT